MPTKSISINFESISLKENLVKNLGIFFNRCENRMQNPKKLMKHWQATTYCHYHISLQVEENF
jgi:hypothetical protein